MFQLGFPIGIQFAIALLFAQVVTPVQPFVVGCIALEGHQQGGCASVVTDQQVFVERIDVGKFGFSLLQVHIAVGERTVAVGKVAEFDLRAEQQRHVQHAVHRFHPTDGF